VLTCQTAPAFNYLDADNPGPPKDTLPMHDLKGDVVRLHVRVSDLMVRL
jgi:hypothetical protein